MLTPANRGLHDVASMASTMDIGRKTRPTPRSEPLGFLAYMSSFAKEPCDCAESHVCKARVQIIANAPDPTVRRGNW
jgi:hypothetical protein